MIRSANQLSSRASPVKATEVMENESELEECLDVMADSQEPMDTTDLLEQMIAKRGEDRELTDGEKACLRMNDLEKKKAATDYLDHITGNFHHTLDVDKLLVMSIFDYKGAKRFDIRRWYIPHATDGLPIVDNDHPRILPTSRGVFFDSDIAKQVLELIHNAVN